MAYRIWFAWMLGSALTTSIAAEMVSKTPPWIVWLWAGTNVAQSWMLMRLVQENRSLRATLRERRGGRG